MKRKPLQVSLHAREASVVELKLGDRVQLDRLTPSPRGYLAERHGRPLDPGVNTVALPAGHYLFKTLSNTHLRVVSGGVTAGIAPSGTKTAWPPPPLPVPPDAGDEQPGEQPSLTIE
jgi:hypothetical protein